MPTSDKAIGVVISKLNATKLYDLTDDLRRTHKTRRRSCAIWG
jgi:hypothetical protein